MWRCKPLVREWRSIVGIGFKVANASLVSRRREESKHVTVDSRRTSCFPYNLMNIDAVLCMGVSPIFTCGSSVSENVRNLPVSHRGWVSVWTRLCLSPKCVILLPLYTRATGLSRHYKWIRLMWHWKKKRKKGNSPGVLMVGGTFTGLSIREWRGLEQSPTQLQCCCHAGM